jgi:hypothetical protein
VEHDVEMVEEISYLLFFFFVFSRRLGAMALLMRGE